MSAWLPGLPSSGTICDVRCMGNVYLSVRVDGVNRDGSLGGGIIPRRVVRTRTVPAGDLIMLLVESSCSWRPIPIPEVCDA